MKYDVYWNLHKDIWSMRHKGRVLNYQSVVVFNDAKFIVQPAGRARVIRERKKNVHAFVRGHVVSNMLPIPKIDKTFIRVRYNPHIHPHFRDEAGNSIFNAKQVILVGNGKCYAKI
jgi:hypothetical protein